MNTEEERAIRTFPETFRSELAAIHAGARNGGAISPRRRDGLLNELAQARKKYTDKLATLRAREQSPAIDDIERAIAKITEEFAAALPAGLTD